MIKMQIVGHLGKDCVVNTVNGKNVINFTVAHTERYKDSQGVQQEKTLWVDCGYWTDRTAIAPYLTKGQLVFVEGAPDSRAYQRNDGSQASALTLRVREIQLLGGSRDKSGGSTNTANTVGNTSPSSGASIPAPSEITEPIDDLPF